MTNAEQQYDIQERDAVMAELEREGREELAAPETDRAAATLGAVIAERFGPLPQRTPGHDGDRARFIATMHALIGWLEANPDVPAPWSSGYNIDVADAAELSRVVDPLREHYDVSDSPEGTSAVIFRPFGPGGAYTPISFHVRVPREGRPL